MSKARAIVAHTLIQIISKGLNIALGLAAFSLLTQYLGQEGFGQYTIITTFLGVFGVMADLGLSIVAIQMMSERRDQEERIFNTIVSIRIITALFALGLAPLIALLFPYSAAVKIGIALTFMSFFFSSLIQLFTALFQQRVAMVFPSYADAVGRLILLGGVIAAMVFQQGLYEILIITLIANAVQCLMLYIKARRIFPIRILVDRAIAHDVFARSWPIALSVTFNLIYLKADILILSLFYPEADVGLYGASYRILEVLVTIPMMFMGITLSSFTDAWANNDTARFSRYLQKSFDAMLIMAIPLVVGTIVIAPALMTFISGADFALSGHILRILILATGMVFIGTLFGHLINIINAQRTMMWGYAAGAIVGLAGYLVFVPLFSFWGAAWMTVAVEGLIMTITWSVFYRRTRLRPQMTRLPSVVGASAVMGVLVWSCAPFVPLFVSLLIGAVSYPVALLALRGVSIEEIQLLLPFKKRYNIKE